MRLEELFQLLLTKPNGHLPRNQWPDLITLPTKSSGGLFGEGKSIFWEHIAQLRKYTDVSADKFSKEYSGSTGWEYEIILAYVDGEVYYSDPGTSRNYTQVSSGHSLQIVTDFDEKKVLVRDKIILDKKEVGKVDYIGDEKIKKRNLKIKDGKLQLGFACHIHSHPQIQSPNLDKKIYTFFSRQDMTSLLSSNYNCMGLVTDRLWFVGKTAESKLPDHRDLQEVTRAEALYPERLLSTAADVMSRYEFVLYVASFGGTLQKVN